MEPVLARLTLHHEIIWVVWHLALAVDSHTVRVERARGGVVVEAAEEVLRPDVVELGVLLEGVHDARFLDCVGALGVQVIGEEELLGAVELPPATLGLLGAVVPPHPDPHAAAPVRLHLLDPRHVRHGVRFRRPHQHGVAHSDYLGGAADGVGVDVLLPLLGLGHGAGEVLGGGENPRPGGR